MKATSNVQPVMPYQGDYGSVVTGSRFLKALHDIPQYVCTCCHRLLFCQNVQPFHTDHYDLSNSIVAKSLSHHYTMNIMGPVTIHETLVDQYSQWPHIPCQSQIEITSGETHKYICTCCKLFMEKNPSMPD